MTWNRRLSRVLAAAGALALVSGGGVVRAAPAACRMELIAEFKVRPHGSPTFEARINGRPVAGVLDTGSFSSLITASLANRLGLHQAEIPIDVVGVGGRRRAFSTTLDTLEFGGGTFRHFRIVVIDALRKSRVDMLVGRDFLTRTDLEFDLAHGAVRMLRPRDCRSDQMAYWAKDGYGEVALESTGETGAFQFKAKLNGAVVEAILDSGAAHSVASLEAAERAHVPLAAPAGEMSGVGAATVARQAGALASFTVGDETVKNTRLEFADIFRGGGQASLGSLIQTAVADAPDMLLGADFLASHRVLVSPSQKRIYFTYVGGPPFDAGAPPPAAAAPK